MEPIPVDLACDGQGTPAVMASSEGSSSHCEYSNNEGEQQQQQQQQEEAPAPAAGTAARFALMSPFRTMRHRLFTEETLPIQNTTSNTSRIPLVANRTRSLSQSQQTLTIGMSRTPSVGTDISFTVPVDLEATPHTMTDKNPFLSQEDDGDGDDEQDHGEEEEEQQQREDQKMMSDHSTVSSISKDSARRINHNAVDDPAAIARAPPAEIFVRSRSNESSGISSNNNKKNSVPRISLVLPTTPPRTPNQNVIPLWQQNWVQGEIMAAHQSSATATAAATAIIGGRPSPPRPPHIVTSSPSPMLPRPAAPKHEAEAALAAGATPSRWQTVQLQTQPQERTSPSPPLRRENQRCVVSLTSPHGEVRLEKQTVVSPNLARVNTDTSRTATTMATTPTTTTATCEPPYNHHRHHSQTRPILLQRPVVVTRAATTPCVTSKFIPVTDQMSSSEHLGTPRPQHTHSQSVGSVGDRDRDPNHPEQQLLGDRPRRKDIRGSATVFSFGSIVGQSSILTPTSNTTPTCSSSNQSPARQFGQMVKANRRLAREAARTSKDDGSFMSSTRRKSAVQQDIEFLWKRVVAKPVRRWTGTEERIDLQRSGTGCLT